MTTLIIGASGQVGRALARHAAFQTDVILTTRTGHASLPARCEALDIADLDAVEALVRRHRPSQVINASAYTAVDRAESEPQLAEAVNARAPAVLAAACRDVGAFLVHYSTDYVFDGRAHRAYREGDATCPLGVYGKSKLEGERAVIARAPDSLVIRTAWVYSSDGHNFLKTMLRLGGERDEIRVVDDQVGNPTSARFIADATAMLLAQRSRPTGLLHVVAEGATSWHGFASAIIDLACKHGLITRRPEVVPIPTSGYPTPAPRPAFSVLDTGRLQSLGIEPPAWQVELAHTVQELTAARAGMLG